jgi:hypothetical protein
LEVERSTLLAVVNILGLDDLKVLLLGALLGEGDQLRPVTDHVLGQLIDLVADLADAINALLLGLPEVLRERTGNLEMKYQLMMNKVNFGGKCQFWYLKLLYLVILNLPRGGINLGLEKQSQSLLEVYTPFRLIPGDLGSADLSTDNLKDQGLLKELPNVGIDLGHLWEEDLTPVGTIGTIHGVTGLQSLIDASKLGMLQAKLELLLADDIDEDGSINSKTRVVGSHLGHASQQATTVFKHMLLASLPTPFRRSSESAT